MALTFHPKNTIAKMSVYIRTLTINDIDRIVELENASFSEEERASVAKFRYRLTVCGELSHGLFTLSKPHPDTPKGVSDFKPKEILIAMISATKSTSPLVTEASMRIPAPLLAKYGAEEPAPTSTTTTTEPAAQATEPPAASSSEKPSEPEVSLVKEAPPQPEGHVEHGDSILIHSICVDAAYRGNGYSQILLKDFCQRMKDAGVSKRVALICHKDMTQVYTKSQLFRYRGGSNVKHGAAEWVDMVYEFTTPPKGRGAAARA